MNAEKQIANTLGILISVAAISASAQLVIPLPDSFSVAPITGQSLAVLMCGHLLKPLKAALSIMLYLALGVAGLPVFSEFSSGWDTFSGPSMGYLIGFVFAAILVGRLASKQENNFANYFIQFLAGTLLILLIGGLFLLPYLSWKDVMSKGILPFLPGGLVKVLVGSVILSVFYNIKTLLRQDLT